jgi:hypothetical protein
MKKRKWPITFTIVVLTCIRMPQTSDELIKRLEDLMFVAKKGGKNSVSYTTFGDEQLAPAPVALPAPEPEAPIAPEPETPAESEL